jgi:hypothetical protein
MKCHEEKLVIINHHQIPEFPPTSLVSRKFFNPFTTNTLYLNTMLSSVLTLVVMAAATPFASAVGLARVVNQCPCSVTLWSVGATISDPYTLAAYGGSYAEQFVRDPKSGGKALKVTLESDGLYTGKPQTIFAYNLDGGQLWYDLSDVFGDAFAGKKLVESSAAANCPTIEWDNGIPPAGSQVKVCTCEADVTLTLCA